MDGDVDGELRALHAQGALDRVAAREAPDAAALRTECARLRKRYQHLKDELRRCARDAGLVGE